MHLPDEIVARIVDELRGHPQALAQCALVNHLWLPYARKALYHTVKLEGEVPAQRFCALACASPGIAECVQVLKFNVYSHYMTLGRCPHKDMQGWIPSTAALLSTRLYNLSVLHFEYIQWQTLCGFDPSLVAALSKFTSVRAVRFWACAFATFADFEELLLCFPALRRLQLDSVAWDEPHARPPYALRLDSLSTSSRSSLQVLRLWLDRIQAHTTLRELELDHLYEEDDLRAAGEILARMDTALQGLTVCCRFSCEGYGKLQDVGRWLRLERNTALRTLRIRIYDLIPDYMHWITNILRLVEAPCLTTVIFDICLFAPNQLSSEIWDDIAWLLSESPRYASLQRVRFVHRGPLAIDLASSALCQQFSLLHARGVLEVENQRNTELYR
ncbi:hypothetical protein PsYK624_064740 [Phanerochaete sordida]|uniref:F-box domain-containing protein n=1 Tax=Phanerochaete sordida TaxID=48140 RepID=A0A9P3LDH1_9APHY|nr:hypothetical protein PsYK624_064740 [Phanerochaete sordida]